MNDLEQLNRLLAHVGQRDGIDLRLNHEGTAGLTLNSGTSVFFEYVRSSRRLYLYTPLMVVPRDDPRRLALFEAMLACNFLNLGCETGGLAVFLHTEQAVYQTGLDAAGLDADRLDRAIDQLVEQREEVLCQLEQARSGESAPALSNKAVGAINRHVLQTWRPVIKAETRD
jgi:hypothetical protein